MPHAIRVADQAIGRVGRNVALQIQVFFFGAKDQRFYALLQPPAQTERNVIQAQFASFDFREIQDVVQQPEQRVARLEYHLQIFPLFVRHTRIQNVFSHSDDGIHRSADLVAHVGNKSALRPAGCFGRFFLFVKRFFGLFLQGNVANERGKSGLAPKRNGLHRHFGKEGLAALLDHGDFQPSAQH